MSLTHKSYNEAEAIILWEKIINHQATISQQLNRDVGVSVATLDYLSNIQQTLSEPKIIEEDKSIFISHVATTDKLTQLYLRDVFDVMLKKEVDIANRKAVSLCLLMIDIDDFKVINDTYGHLVGDEVLIKIGSCINKSVREMDLAARYGGEELAVIMPNTETSQAIKIADRICINIENLVFDGFNITASIGISTVNKMINSPKSLISSADSALYTAKNEGKNRVRLAKNITTPN
jgi:diguanylate cyclase (GGDEF)-like protein